MRYRLADRIAPAPGDSLLDQGAPFDCWDMIGEPYWDHDTDGVLFCRSAYEFARDSLTDAQQAELDRVDALWRTRRAAFDAIPMMLEMGALRRPGALQDWVTDEAGRAPRVPRSHWWAWPGREWD